ncbi:MAG: hypothetical protein AAGF87_09380 [Bacteroidota bacterium]
MYQPQYLYDPQGNKMGVFIPIKDWERLDFPDLVIEVNEEDIDDSAVLEPRTKEQVVSDLKAALREVKDHIDGKIEMQTIEEFLADIKKAA